MCRGILLRRRFYSRAAKLLEVGIVADGSLGQRSSNCFLGVAWQGLRNRRICKFVCPYFLGGRVGSESSWELVTTEHILRWRRWSLCTCSIARPPTTSRLQICKHTSVDDRPRFFERDWHWSGIWQRSCWLGSCGVRARSALVLCRPLFCGLEIIDGQTA